MTCDAPPASASCTATCPTEPAAPRMATRSPGCSPTDVVQSRKGGRARDEERRSGSGTDVLAQFVQRGDGKSDTLGRATVPRHPDAGAADPHPLALQGAAAGYDAACAVNTRHVRKGRSHRETTRGDLHVERRDACCLHLDEHLAVALERRMDKSSR